MNRKWYYGIGDSGFGIWDSELGARGSGLGARTRSCTYSLAARLPALERFELAAQLRRAAVSIPSNIAEGHGRAASQRYLNHGRIAAGSLAELDTQLELTRRLGYLPPADLADAFFTESA